MIDAWASSVLMIAINATWQIALIGALTWLLLRLARVRSAPWRYGICVGALVAIIACPILVAVAPRAGLVWLQLDWAALRAVERSARSPIIHPRTLGPASRSEPASDTYAALTVSDPATVDTPARAITAGEVIEPTASVGTATAMPWPRWAVFVLGAGVGVMLVRLMFTQIRLWRLQATSSPSDRALTDMLARLRTQTETRTCVNLRMSERVNGPILIGLWRPVILLPRSMATMSARNLESIFLHELAHVRRHDQLVNLVQRVAEAVLFFHPVVWLLGREMRIQRELCCDAWVIARTNRDVDYADSLAEVARRMRSGGQRVPSLAMAEFRHQLPHRIAAVLDGTARNHRSLSRRGLAGIGAGAMAVAVMAGACSLSAGGREHAGAAHDIQSPPTETTRPATAGEVEQVHMFGPRGSARFEAPFEFDRDIPVHVAVGTDERPDVVQIQSIRFETRDDQIVKKMEGSLFSWPHSDWHFSIELLDGQGDVIGRLEYNLHNSGRIETTPAEEPAPIKCDFLPIGPRGLTGGDKPARFVIRIDRKPLETETITRIYDIRGTVVDATPDYSDDYFANLEHAAASGSENQFWQALKRQPPPRPMPNVVVLLRGESVSRKAVTDPQGKFEFAGLKGPTYGPYGGMVKRAEYEIFAEMPSLPSWTKVERMATARKKLRLLSNCNLNLELRSDRIAVRGRVTDVHGRPVAYAKVTAVLDILNNVAYQQYLENHDPPTWSAVSNVDGSYELQGIDPANCHHVAGCLQGGKVSNAHVDIHVEADGFEQDKENIPEVPLVTEDVLSIARRLLTVYSQVSQRAGGPGYQEKEGLTFPASKGNTIAGIDIILKQSGAGAQ